MRPPLPFLIAPLLLWSAALPSARAQEQERTLMERIENPDRTQSFGAQKKEFFGAKGFTGGKEARVKDFAMSKAFNAKDYLTGAFSMNKAFWKGDFKYSTRSADTKGDGMASRYEKKDFATRAVPVSELYDGGKTFVTEAMPTKVATMRGRSQDKIDIQGPQALNTIQDGTFTELKTIDDVRNLLNKN